MGDGDETIRMLQEYGLEETISEIFSGTMDKRATTTVEVEINIREVVKQLKKLGKKDTQIIEYLEELEDDREGSIKLYQGEQSPFVSYVYITFKDSTVVVL